MIGKKLPRLLNTLKGSRMTAHVEPHGDHDVRWGGGSIFSTSQKKINTNIFTDSELVEVDDTIPQLLRVSYFLEKRGHSTEKAKLYQD